jgi:hypothetical protein
MVQQDMQNQTINAKILHHQNQRQQQPNQENQTNTNHIYNMWLTRHTTQFLNSPVDTRHAPP